jgi:histidinol phosphatase-like enzyme (inositol monophosphatase family)
MQWGSAPCPPLNRGLPAWFLLLDPSAGPGQCTTVDEPGLAALEAFARRLAEAARRETLPRWREGCGVEDKGGAGGFDPVTDADREAERAMRALIETEHPGHGIAGEEFDDRPGDGRFVWSLDPVDGTRAFVCRLPSWVTLVALLDEGRPVLAVIDAPALDELYIGGASAALLIGGRETPIATSGCRTLAEARLSTTDPYLFAGADSAAWERVRERVRTTRYGLDGYGYARVAAGSLDLVLEAGLKPHDYNALIPVVRAAGGAIGDWRGGDDFTQGQVIAAATPDLYAAAVEAMA